MRKTVLAVLLALALTACAPTAPAPTPPEDLPPIQPRVEDQPGDASPAALTLQEDLGIEVNGAWYPILQDAAPLLAALGGDYDLYAADSCVFPEWGDDKEFEYKSWCVFTNPDEKGRDIWYQIALTDDTLQTARGIAVGDTLESVYAAYGEGYYWEGASTLTYSVSGQPGDIASPNIQFTVENGLVALIDIYYPTNVT